MTRAIPLLALTLSLGWAGWAPAQETPPANPLARPPAWVGKWKGESVSLELGREAGAGMGELTVGGKGYPLTVTPKPDDSAVLEGSFKVDEHAFPCTIRLTGPDTLTLTSDGAAHELRRVAPPAPQNPLGKPPTPNPLGTPPAPPEPAEPPRPVRPQPGGLGGGPGPLADAWQGPAQRRQNAGGAWSCELPAPYTVANEDGLGLLVNPGVQMQPGTVPEALLVCEIGELSPQEAQQPAGQLLRAVVPTLQEMLSGQGITVTQPREPTDVQVDGQPAGVYEWSGKNMAGNPLSVWMGVAIRGPRYVLVLGVVQQGKEAAFLPKMKRVFSSIRIAPAAGPLQGAPGGQPGGQPGGGGYQDDEGN